MRSFGLAIASAALLLAGPVVASTHNGTPLIPPPYTVETSKGPIPAVVPGDHVAVACAVLDSDKAGNDVRVVLSLAPQAGQSTPGFEAVIPTDEERLPGSVRFRVPEMESLINQTVRLKVYVLGDKGAQSCDAGLVKIV